MRRGGETHLQQSVFSWLVFPLCLIAIWLFSIVPIQRVCSQCMCRVIASFPSTDSTPGTWGCGLKNLLTKTFRLLYFCHRTISSTTEWVRKPPLPRSVPMKVAVAAKATSNRGVLQQSMSPSTHAGSFAHEIDLLDVLALDLNTNDFPLFFSPRSIFFLLETSISASFQHGEFNCTIMSEGVEGVHDKMPGWLLSSLVSLLLYFYSISFFYLPKSLHSLYQIVSIVLAYFPASSRGLWECNNGTRGGASLCHPSNPLCCVFAGWYHWLWSTVTHCCVLMGLQ